MTGAGLELAEQAPAAAAATVDADGAPSDVWADLVGSEPFRAALVDAALDATDGGLAPYLPGPADPRASWADVLDAAAVFAESDETPTLDVRMSSAFFDRRAAQRRRTSRLLATLARGCAVRITASGLVQRRLVREHRTDLPVSRDDVAPGGSPPVAQRVEAALHELDPDGREVGLLRVLADEPGETQPYAALYADAQVSRSRVRQVVARLADLGLVETFDGPGGRHVGLLPAGRELLETLDLEIGRQRTLYECVSGTGQPSGSPVYPATAHVGEGEGQAAADRFDAHYLARWEHAAAVGSAVGADVAAVDARIDPLDDGREPGWSFDGETLVVSAEYGHSALQFWVRIALALANWRTFEHVISPDVLDDILAEHPRAVLRGCRQLGFLPDCVDTGEEYVDALQDAAEHLRELTKKRHHGEFDDRAEGASIITRDALGLSTLMVHLLDLDGVDVVREVRLPEFTRNYDAEARAAVAKSVATGIAQQSTYDHHVAHRLLFEDRPEKRRAALAVEVDAADPVGEPIGSWVVVGPGADQLEGELRRAVRSPAELHDDAPEFAVSVRVGTTGRPAFAMAARRTLDGKHLDATREAVSALQAFAGSPYDVARAVYALEAEEYRREVRLDEVRYALGSLPADRLLPDAPPTVSKVVRALLRADGPMTQADLAEAAGVSTRSVRRHADRLAAFDLLRETGEGWRLALSHRGERHRDVLPWFATPNADREGDPRDATTKGVLWEVVDAADPPPGADALRAALSTVATLLLPLDVRQDVVEAWPWAEPLLAAVRALAAEERGLEASPGETVAFGAEPEQTSLSAVSESGEVGHASMR